MAYRNPNVRRYATARAVKMMKLFNHPHFTDIMEAVDPKPDKAAFDVACQNAGLDPCETDWLWNYLKNCNFAYYDCLPEAAASGW